mgnify:CR=1 FL=1
MNFKIKITPAILIALVLFNMLSVSAITGSIGNARMILHGEQGDSFDKYVTVKNVNDVPLDIELSASGDLADYVDIKDEKFTLAAGEEKQAQFTIKAAKAGTTETSINVQFKPQNEKTGVGLTSTIIIIAEENSFWSDLFGKKDANNTDTNDNNGNVASNPTSKLSGSMIIILIITLIITAILIYLIVMLYKKANKNINRGKIIKQKKSSRK